jgi:hypothetical protein
LPRNRGRRRTDAAPTVIQSPFWLYFPEQWDASHRGTTCACGRRRLAIDKDDQPGTTLGFSHIHGSMIPDNFEFF